MMELDKLLERVGQVLVEKVPGVTFRVTLFRAWELDDYDSEGEFIALVGLMAEGARPHQLKVRLGTNDLDALESMEDAIVNLIYAEYRKHVGV